MHRVDKNVNLIHTWPQNSFIWLKTALTSGMTSLPSTKIGVFFLFRRAICRTARPSVKFIFSPLNMASRMASTFLSLACEASAIYNYFFVRWNVRTWNWNCRLYQLNKLGKDFIIDTIFGVVQKNRTVTWCFQGQAGKVKNKKYNIYGNKNCNRCKPCTSHHIKSHSSNLCENADMHVLNSVFD